MRSLKTPFPCFVGKEADMCLFWIEVWYVLVIRRKDDIVQITDFLDFLHEYCNEKTETFTEF